MPTNTVKHNACPECLRRSFLLELLGPYLDRLTGDRPGSSALPLLGMANEQLTAAAAPQVAPQILARIRALSATRMNEALGAAGCWALSLIHI